jgi:GxxExxY protein
MPLTENEISRHVVDAAFRLHKELGPGLFERVYETALARALENRGFNVRRQVFFPVVVGNVTLERGFRVDLMVDEKVVIEVKSQERLALVHRKQLLTYLRLADKRLGLVVNFGAARIKEGIIRIVNQLPE